MRAKNFGIFLLISFGCLLLSMLGGFFDEERRQLFDLWLAALMMIAVFVGVGVFHSRRSKRPRVIESAPEPTSATEPIEAIQPPAARPPILLVTLSALVVVFASWIVLIHAGKAPGRHEDAFTNLQMITAIVTAAAAGLLSVWVPKSDPSTAMKLRLAAFGQMFLAVVGIFAMPLIAVRIWFGFIDFERYAPKIAGAWIYLTVAGVLLCLLRPRRRKHDPR